MIAGDCREDSEKQNATGYLLQIVRNVKGPVYEPGDQGEASGEGQAHPEQVEKSPCQRAADLLFRRKKNFSKDQKVNRKNNRWLCSDISEVPIIMSTKFPATVMVLGVVSNEGGMMPHHFFAKGLKINADEYSI